MGSSNEKRTANRTSHGEWLVNVTDDVVVPMTTLEVIDALRTSRLSEQSLVWRIGMNDWTAVLDVPQLRLAASSRPPPPAQVPVRATLAPFPTQAPAPRGRSAPSLGFPTLEDRPSLPQPAPTSPSAFSAAARADWQADVDARQLTPVPAIATPLTHRPASSMPNSLAPITAEADAEARARAPGTWAEFDELLSNERRADQRNSRRVVLGAAVGSATLAALFAFWVLRSPAPQAVEPTSSAAQAGPAAEASPAPLPAPTLEAIAAPSARALNAAPAARRLAPQWVAPRLARRTKPATSAAHSNEGTLDSPAISPAPDTTGSPGAAAEVAVVPVAPREAAPPPSAAPEAAPLPPAPIAPESP